VDFNLAGRSANTAATANHCAAQLWNPSTATPVWVGAISFVQRNAVVSNIALKHSSARGATPATSVTAAATNDLDGRTAPVSGAVAEFALFTTQPTLIGNIIWPWNFPAAVGAGVIIPFATPNRHGLLVAPGTGLCIYTPDAVILQAADIAFHCYE
jgi:hypothetical protein